MASHRLSENQDLVGLTSFQIFDKVVEALSNAGLLIILNNHVSILIAQVIIDCHYSVFSTTEVKQ